MRLTTVPIGKPSQMSLIISTWASTRSATAVTGSVIGKPSTWYSPSSAACTISPTVPLSSSQSWIRRRSSASVTPGRSATIAVVVPAWLARPNHARATYIAVGVRALEHDGDDELTLDREVAIARHRAVRILGGNQNQHDVLLPFD